MNTAELTVMAQTEPAKFVKTYLELSEFETTHRLCNNWNEYPIVHGVQVTLVEQDGGSEGDGEYMHKVFGVSMLGSPPIMYFKVVGCYNSWDDSTWNEEAEIVTPREVTKIEYV